MEFPFKVQSNEPNSVWNTSHSPATPYQALQLSVIMNIKVLPHYAWVYVMVVRSNMLMLNMMLSLFQRLVIAVYYFVK